jgi:hypothetical protein
MVDLFFITNSNPFQVLEYYYFTATSQIFSRRDLPSRPSTSSVTMKSPPACKRAPVQSGYPPHFDARRSRSFGSGLRFGFESSTS